MTCTESGPTGTSAMSFGLALPTARVQADGVAGGAGHVGRDVDGHVDVLLVRVRLVRAPDRRRGGDRREPSVAAGLATATPTCDTSDPNPRTAEEMNGPTWPLPTHRIAPPSSTTERGQEQLHHEWQAVASLDAAVALRGAAATASAGGPGTGAAGRWRGDGAGPATAGPRGGSPSDAIVARSGPGARVGHAWPTAPRAPPWRTTGAHRDGTLRARRGPGPRACQNEGWSGSPRPEAGAPSAGRPRDVELWPDLPGERASGRPHLRNTWCP